MSLGEQRSQNIVGHVIEYLDFCICDNEFRVGRELDSGNVRLQTAVVKLKILCNNQR